MLYNKLKQMEHLPIIQYINILYNIEAKRNLQHKNMQFILLELALLH